MRRLILVAALFVMCLMARPAQASLIDPFIGVRGGGTSTPITSAMGEPIVGVPCTIEDLLGALCWEFFNDTGEFIVAFSGMFDNPACDGTSEDPEDCLLSLHEDSEFGNLQTFPDEGFGIQEFRFSGGVIPPGEPPPIEEFLLLATLTSPEFIVYGFEFALNTTLTITDIETVDSVPEPGLLMLFGTAGAAIIARRRSQRSTS